MKVLEPIVSEEKFAALQRILNAKKQNHWRARTDYERRFVYGGFLRCGECRNLVYTHSHRPRDWYVCKSRTAESRRSRREKGLPDCENVYMRRKKLEECLDVLISKRLRDPAFLKQVATVYANRQSGEKPESAHVEKALAELQKKRRRVIEAFCENLIDRAEKVERLATLDREEALYGDLAARAAASPPKLTARDLASVFRVFHEWEFLTGGDKRKLLQAAMPEIHVQNYRVSGLALIPGLSPRSNEVSRTGTGSSRRPA